MKMYVMMSIKYVIMSKVPHDVKNYDVKKYFMTSQLNYGKYVIMSEDDFNDLKHTIYLQNYTSPLLTHRGRITVKFSLVYLPII